MLRRSRLRRRFRRLMRSAGGLPHASALYAVVGPSLVRGVSADGAQQPDLSTSERATRVAAAQAFMQQTHVPVVSIEYCAADDRACARTTAAQVVATGITPY